MWTSALPVVEEAGANIKITSNKRDEPLALQWNWKGSGGSLYNGAVPSPYSSVSQPPGRGPVPGPGINYTGPREA